jgi:hypothetical protein
MPNAWFGLSRNEALWTLAVDNPERLTGNTKVMPLRITVFERSALSFKRSFSVLGTHEIR